MKLLLCLIFVATQLLKNTESISWGKFIQIEEAPYLVSLLFQSKVTNNIYLCGGSIISEYWIVTAAHCFMSYPIIPNHIVSGENNVHIQKIPQSSTYKIEKVFVHGGYINGVGIVNDIALIKLEQPIEFNERRQPIKIRRMPPSDNDTVTVMGFGDQGAARGTAKVLRQSEVTVVHECDAFSTNPDHRKLVFCAGNGTTDVCSGDSGGPAVINGELAGLVSYGPPCEISMVQSSDPGTYTLVGAFYDWIVKITGLKDL